MIYKLKPILKQRLWGGNTLPKICGIPNNEKIGEAWIMSCIGADNSLISDTVTLLDLFKQNPDIVAKGYKGNFPLLIKLIDAQDDLSIQVHPNSKTEFWHILNKNHSHLYMGFNQNTDKSTVEAAIKSGQITNLLNHIEVQEGDSYLIEPGTIHAIGKGTFLIEIQQSADVTYRLYDFNRVDVDGKPRELHVNEALECINFNQHSITKNEQKEQLISCKFFNVFKQQIGGTVELKADEKSFHAITVLDGNIEVELADQKIFLHPFETCFVTANSGAYKITGDATIIRTTL